MDFPTAHALLRDRRHWRGSALGVAPAVEGAIGDGDLVLARVPGSADGKAVTVAAALPYAREVSGIAAGPCDALFVADTVHDRVLFIDGTCNARAWLPPSTGDGSGVPGTFRQPRGLACAEDGLLVADTGNARVQGLAFPQLEPNRTWADGSSPTAVAVDSRQRLLAIDAAGRALHRFSASGAPDAAFDGAVAASGRLARPLFVACNADDSVFVSDAQNDEVVVFDPAGTFLHTLPGPAGWMPGALAIAPTQVYVADAASGRVAVFVRGAVSAQYVGSIAGWQGPVTAMGVGPDGTLFIKPGLDDVFHRFTADAACLPSGVLTAGPFDAGEGRVWERAFADIEAPAGTSVAFEVATAASDAAPPGTADWVQLPAFDVLLAAWTAPARRFAWLRLTLATTDRTATPRVRQARLATAAEDWLDWLPLTYRYNDGADGFLSRWLRLLRGGFDRVAELLDDMPRLADPRFEPAASVDWLAQWFGLELPAIADDTQRRALLARAVGLMARRGTRASIAEFVELHTGIAPAIVEAFEDRRVWVLGQHSLLDVDTRLPALDPLGMVVPDPAQEAVVPIGRAVVGGSGPLAEFQLGLPLFAEEAYRFCVVVDAYRAADPATVQEIRRIVDREKPAHTDWRLELVAPELRIGFQARVGIDAIVGGDPPPLALGASQLSVTANLPPSDVSRVGEATLDGSLTLH